MATMDKVVAERKILAKNPEGEEFATSIQFGIPYETEKHGWCCNLSMEGIDKPRFSAGMDSLQAVALTMSLCESILLSRLDKGWTFYWPDTMEEMDILEMFNLKSFVSVKNRI